VFDQDNEEIPDEPVTFTATGGPITPEGVYTGEDVGEQTITVKVTSTPSITDTSIVTVDPVTAVPTSVVMIPETARITQGDSVTFTVTVFDQDNEEMPDEPVTFTATGGPITPEGVYTGEDVGEQTITVKVTSTPSITDTSIVTVDPVTAVPTSVVMIPETARITQGDSVTFTVTVFDQDNEEIPDEPVTFTATGGPITPEGVYTGEDVGEQTVTVKVTSNPAIADTSAVTVKAEGDVNGDGTVDILDVRLCLHLMYGCVCRLHLESSMGLQNSESRLTWTATAMLISPMHRSLPSTSSGFVPRFQGVISRGQLQKR
jgi:hypothetical protein